MKGAAKGLGVGLVTGTGLIVGGAATGVYQITRGVINTPNAIIQKSKGKEWDPVKRQWFYYNLEEE